MRRSNAGRRAFDARETIRYASDLTELLLGVAT
jgi:hypothetical protein